MCEPLYAGSSDQRHALGVTNSQGTGTAHVVLSNVSAAPGTFYVDISVLNGGGGAGNDGDTFIAGPFTLH